MVIEDEAIEQAVAVAVRQQRPLVGCLLRAQRMLLGEDGRELTTESELAREARRQRSQSAQ